MAAPTQSSIVRAIAERLWALNDEAKLRAEEGRRTAAALWRRRPSGRMVAGFAAGLAAMLIALHFLAALALRDMLEGAPPKTQISDLQIEGVAPVILLAGRGKASVFTASRRTATLPSPSDRPTLVNLAPPQWVVISDARGSTAATRLGPATATHKWLKSVGDHWRRVVWRPISGMSATLIFPWVSQFDPLEVDPAVQPRRLGIHRSCAECPEIVDLSSGSNLVGPLWWQRSSASGRRHVATMPATGISRFEVKASEWAACVAAGSCRALPATGDGRLTIADPRLAAPYLQWLGARTGRVFRLPTADEWELAARASTQPGGAGIENMFDPMTEWVCIPVPSGRFGDCVHGRRGVTGRPYEGPGESEPVVGLRLIETLPSRR